MSDAPERIWRNQPWHPSQINHGIASWGVREHAEPDAVEYVRADRLEAIEAENRRLREALQPFAKFLDAAELMGGPSRLTKDSDSFYSVESGQVGLRELTLGDLKAARAALSTDGGEARALQSQTEGDET